MTLSVRSVPRRRIVGAAVVLTFLSAGAAQAASVETTGSKASNSGRTLTVTDTKYESDLAYANWNSSGANRVTVPSDGASASVTPGTLNNFRACRDQGSWNPDNCSSYVSP
jgi:hypothetical protein